MITIVCPNPAIDRIARVPRFRVGEIQRVQQLDVVVGGKGINVARIVAELGWVPRVLGFAGGHAGRQVVEGVRAFGGEPRFTEIAGESRTCYAVIDPERGTQTVINERGPHVSPREVEAFWESFEEEVARLSRSVPGPWVAFSGSLPPGVPGDLYARMITLCRSCGIKTLLDASGEALAAGLQAGPTVVKINRQEHTEVQSRLGVRQPETEAYIITDGPRPVEVVTGGKRWFVQPPRVQEANLLGAGDAFLAGLVVQLAQGAPWREAVPFAAACASLKVAQLLPTLGVELEKIQALARSLAVTGG